MQKDLKEIKRLARKNEKDNCNFRYFLKGCGYHKVDKTVHKLNEKYFSEFDCKQCGNCCRELKPKLSKNEVKLISKKLGISFKRFKKKYVQRTIFNGFILKGDECPFLRNNMCEIYEFRPEACKSFPHLNKPGINKRLIEMIDNSYICPIVFNVLSELKDIFAYNKSSKV